MYSRHFLGISLYHFLSLPFQRSFPLYKVLLAAVFAAVMSSAEDVGIWDGAIQAYDNGLLKESIELFGSMATVSSKISFNIGSAYLVLDEVENALKV